MWGRRLWGLAGTSPWSLLCHPWTPAEGSEEDTAWPCPSQTGQPWGRASAHSSREEMPVTARASDRLWSQEAKWVRQVLGAQLHPGSSQLPPPTTWGREQETGGKGVVKGAERGGSCVLKMPTGGRRCGEIPNRKNPGVEFYWGPTWEPGKLTGEARRAGGRGVPDLWGRPG